MVELMRLGEAVFVLGCEIVSNTQTHTLKSQVPAGIFPRKREQSLERISGEYWDLNASIQPYCLLLYSGMADANLNLMSLI